MGMDTNGHPVSAASGEPEVLGRLRGYADTRLYAIPGEYVCDAAEILNAYAALRAERDAAVRERAECVAREQRWLARLAACEGVMVEFVDAEAAFAEETRKNNPYIVTDTWQQSARRLDAARKALKDSRAAVASTPPQDAATTRGEG